MGLPELSNPNEVLATIKRIGSVAEYRIEFAKLAALVRAWTEHAMVGAAMAGLREDLRGPVRIPKTRTVACVMSLA